MTSASPTSMDALPVRPAAPTARMYCQTSIGSRKLGVSSLARACVRNNRSPRLSARRSHGFWPVAHWKTSENSYDARLTRRADPGRLRVVGGGLRLCGRAQALCGTSEGRCTASCRIDRGIAEVVTADTAHDADHLRQAIAAKGALAVITNNPSRALKYPLDKHLYAQPSLRVGLQHLRHRTCRSAPGRLRALTASSVCRIMSVHSKQYGCFLPLAGLRCCSTVHQDGRHMVRYGALSVTRTSYHRSESLSPPTWGGSA